MAKAGGGSRFSEVRKEGGDVLFVGADVLSEVLLLWD